MSKEVKRYAERDAYELDKAGNYYCRHVSAMTGEGLHSKSDIAAELGWRDMQIDALLAERDALIASSAKWKRDSELLDAIEGECWDVRFLSSPNGDAGDSSISIEIVGRFMAKPCERVVGENYSENLRAALEQAMTADAYPPERPEYDERGRPFAALQGAQP